MISPGFFSFFNAQRGLMAAQMALNTVNHNISNANTAGYSRQRVDLQAYTPYTLPTIAGINIGSGQLGQGVDVAGVSRSRDQFLDAQFRLENSILGMNKNARDILEQIEGILVEPSNGGINQSIQNLFAAAQELSLHPESNAVRADFLQQAVDVITIFQQQATQLSTLRQTLVGDPDVPGSFNISHLAINVAEVNTKLENIVRINQQIVTIVASGAQPNDLYDQRDKLLDDISKLVDMEVVHQENGQINLSIGGELMIRGALQVNALEVVENPGPLPDPIDVPSLVRTVNGGVVLNDGVGSEIARGQIKAILDMGGSNPTHTTVYGTLDHLNTMLVELATQLNTLQQTGRDAYGNVPGAAAPLFTRPDLLAPMDIFNIQVNTDLLDDPRRVAAALDDPGLGFLGVGDGRNALAMAQLRDGSYAALGNTSFVDFFNGVISKLGIDTRSFQDRTTSQASLVGNLDLRRDALSGVNVDEEMIDMLRYQRAFEASSKLIGVFDEMLKTLINMV